MRRIAHYVVLGVAMSLVLTLVTPAFAGEADKADEDRWSGRIVNANKDTSTITVQKDLIRRDVVYTNGTKFTFRNKPGSVDDLRDGVRVICLGKYDERNRLVANRIDVREKR